MKKKIWIAPLLLLSHFIYSQEVAQTKLIGIDSKELRQQREILIYIPKNYKENTLVNYDVIYVFDAQNREFFDFTHSIVSFVSNTEKKYIVVGITSPFIEKYDYARNNDLLPKLETKEAIDRYGKYSGNADNFLGYMKNEITTYIDNNYRTTKSKVAIGHSLSGSLLIYTFLKAPNLFNDYLIISPNLAYDNERLTRGLIEFDYQNINDTTFLFLSNANEGNGYWTSWIPAREKVYSFFETSDQTKKVHFLMKEFPNETHWSTFAPALSYGMKEYFQYKDNQKVQFSEEEYVITLRVKVPNKNDEAYIAGNQSSMGNWNPRTIKMEFESDFERTIILKVRAPVEFKITRGSWETEGEIMHNGGFNNVKIDPVKSNAFDFEILEWADRMK
jgi:predicted alpha/beta superfamily hydrolase